MGIINLTGIISLYIYYLCKRSLYSLNYYIANNTEVVLLKV